MENEGGDVVPAGRAEIDTRAPFRSVKEAIVLFGERVLASEVYTNKLNEMRAAANSGESAGVTDLGSVFTELEETKQTLEKAREDNLVMANCLYSLREELQKTQQELRQVKARELEKRVAESQAENFKFAEKSTAVAAGGCSNGRPELQRRRYVKFANPPTQLTQVIVTPVENPQVLERTFSESSTTTAKKKKSLIPLLAGIFGKKNAPHFSPDSPKSRARH